MWVGLAVGLIVAYMAGMYFLANAKVTLYANGSKVDIDTNFAVDPSLNASNPSAAVLAGQTITVSKDLSAAFTPTGKKDIGTKASGTISFRNCEDTNAYPFNAGNPLTSQGLSFVTNDTIT